ncbi:MAG: cytochrome c oxidase accessory protein CcoG [Alphaproteobacteria bacterium]|jgi:cytochrome c oxidase accessory protein FixG|nr:cytochrome c oxidase accessory protein CcoG [Alphaproteobacteria bacterium]
MLDENITFFEKQKRIYPRAVEGRYRRLKWAAIALLLGIYYATPWLRWHRGENLPDQAVLIDMPARRAYFFGIEIWPDEVYFITGILVLAAIGLFFATSLLGRVWCGYACPQTVWTDLFVWVEEKIQGDRNARIRLDQQGLTFGRIWKKTLTHALWIVIGLCTGGAWVFYFNDAPTLLDHIRHLDVPWSVGSWILGLTASTYLMAGYAREQVCKYMCPYARFQSAMFDRDTLIIGYDPGRGEPRGKHKKGTSWEGHGHCIDCTQCVAVCPVGIDIRNGLQMECIACGLCVDACNDIMDKVDLPRGLIRYDTQRNYDARKGGNTNKSRLRIWRPRTFYYMAVLSLVSGLMIYGLIARPRMELHASQNRNPLFVKLSDGSIRNNYLVKIFNKTHETRHFALKVRGLDTKEVSVQSAIPLDLANLEVTGGIVAQYRVMITAEKQAEPRRRIEISAREVGGKLQDAATTIFVSGDEQ